MRIKFQTMRQRARRTASYQRAINRAFPPADQPPVLGSQADWDRAIAADRAAAGQPEDRIEQLRRLR
jgi:hypothetical protein